MGSDTIVAITATAIALAALWVSYVQTRATRSHNRQSVRPLLVMRRVKGHEERKVGVLLINAGLGPAIVTNSVVLLDGEHVGQWNYHTQERVLASLPVRPSAYSLRPGAVVLAGQSAFLLHLDECGEDERDWFWELITRRLVIEIRYESLYGGENFKTAPPLF
ncbi:hypothetical protein [Streptomyces lushanensis]|uniref:hypothetical protein n=1 Tax=Streptomyces lushanensis TaxID=1434255 RepID=UPI001B8070E1|nr:hypothetical protein [Streptomyces lushanensis]